MKSKSSLLFAIALCATAILLACHPPGSPPLGKGSLRITIGNKINALTITPPTVGTTATLYKITGTGPNGSKFSTQTGGDPVTVPGLSLGQWNISVDALNAANDTIGHGESSTAVAAGENSVTVAVLLATSGSGSLSLTVTWDPRQVQGPGGVSASITPVKGGFAPPLTAFTGTDGSLSSATSGILPGYYFLNLSLLDHAGNVVASTTDLVWIVNAQTSTGKFDFTNAVNTGSIKISITPLPNPLNVSIVQSGSTLSAVVANYSGTDLSYQWYMNGTPVGTNSSTYTLPSTPGCYWISVIVWTTDWAQAGSATTSYQIGNPVVNVEGYWLATFALDQGSQQKDPALMYIKQTGTSLSAGMIPFFLSGSLEGSTISLTGQIQGNTVNMEGTVSGREINGAVDAGALGRGTFHMVPSPPSSHLEIQGTCKGVTLSVNTDYAQAERPQTTTIHGFRFDLNVNGTPGGLQFQTPNTLSAGTYSVTTDGNQPGSIAVSVGTGGPSVNATGGTVVIAQFDVTGTRGHFNLSFADGFSTLDGDFDLVFNGSGTASAYGTGMWSNVQAAASVYSGAWVFTWTHFNINYVDDQKTLQFNLNASGELGTGDYSIPSATWGEVHITPRSGPVVEADVDLPGTLHITRLSETGMAGSYAMSFSAGGSIIGNFDLSF